MKNKYINNPNEIEQINEIYWTTKMSNISNFLLEEYKKNNNNIYSYSKKTSKNSKNKTKSRKDFNVFEFAPEEILKNENLMLKSISDGFISYFNLKECLRDNKSFALRYLREVEYNYYFCLSEKMLEDEDIFNICIKKDAKTYTSMNYNSILYKIHGSKEKASFFLDINPAVFEFFEDSYKSDIDLAKKALRLDIKNTEFLKKSISNKIFKDRDLIDKALTENIDFFLKINNKYRDNEEFLIPIIEKKPSFIEHVSKRLKAKKSFISFALGAYNLMDHIPEEFKKDHDMMKIHLLSQPHSRFEISKYQDIKKLLVECIIYKSYMYEYLLDKEKLDEEYIFAVLNHNNFYKKIEDYFHPYKKVSIFQILPTELQRNLISECLDHFTKNKKTNILCDELEELSLSFARNKYTNIYLEKNLININIENKKTKLKI